MIKAKVLLEKRQTDRERDLTFEMLGSNPGPLTCKANVVPLSYIPISNVLLYSKDSSQQQHEKAVCSHYRLVGLVVRRPPRERKVPGSNPACAGIFSGSSHTSDLNIGTPVATQPGAWCYRVSTGTGRPGVSIL